MGGRDGVTARCSTVQTSVQTAKNILSNDHIGKSNDMVSFLFRCSFRCSINAISKKRKVIIRCSFRCSFGE